MDRTDKSKDITFPEAVPPSTPLVCPNGQGNGAQNGFVGKNGTAFTYHGAPLKLSGYTFYPATVGGAAAWHTPEFTHYLDHILDMGMQAGQDLIRPTDFWSENDQNRKPDGTTVWKNVDYLVCAAQQRGMFVVMDVSAFQKFLLSRRYDSFDARNWTTFLEAVGEHYKDQNAIAMYSIVGEPPPPKSVEAMNKLVDFYRAVTDTLHQADEGHHLINAGGFIHMEDESKELPWWHKIYTLPNNDIVGFKTYSFDDLHLMPTIASYAKEINKPLLDEEFGLPQRMGDAQFAGGEGYNKLYTSRAQFYQDVYNMGEQVGVTGFVFWDMGCELKGESYQVSPNTPAVWQVIQQHAPLKPSAPDPNKPLCS